MTENDRLEEYSRRGYHWPPAWVPPTKGWQALMERREKQLMSLPSSQARWDGWTVMVGSSSLVKNFTEKGFAVVRAPDSVNERLQTNLRAHKDTARFEDTPSRQIDVIKGRLRPKFIDQEDLNREILLELLPMFEEWSGVKLRPAIAYGLRIYQNESSLLMHVDKIEDHVISAILHVGHEYDDEEDPWPLVIESFDGSTVAVNLEPGEMLFYESAKCMHGRPRPFKGKFYSSVFIHYVPVTWTLSGMDSQYYVPPHWLDGLDDAEARGGRNPDPAIPSLEIIGTGFNEPSCPDGWCNTPPRQPPRSEQQPLDKAHDQGQRRNHSQGKQPRNRDDADADEGRAQPPVLPDKQWHNKDAIGSGGGSGGGGGGSRDSGSGEASVLSGGGSGLASGAGDTPGVAVSPRHTLGDMGKKLRGGVQAASAMASARVKEAAKGARASRGRDGGDGSYGNRKLLPFFIELGTNGDFLSPVKFLWQGPAAVFVLAALLYFFCIRGRQRSGFKNV